MKNTLAALALLVSLSATAEEQTQDTHLEMLPIITFAIEQATEWTLPELQQGLERLDNLYSNDMKTVEGRKRWHGSVVETLIDTNALEKVQVHEDGYRHAEKFHNTSPSSIGEKISAAEQKAKMEELRKRRAEAAAKRKADRIAALQTNLVWETQQLMKQKQWPEELARLYLQTELNKLLGAVELNVTVKPQSGE